MCISHGTLRKKLKSYLFPKDISTIAPHPKWCSVVLTPISSLDLSLVVAPQSLLYAEIERYLSPIRIRIMLILNNVSIITFFCFRERDAGGQTTCTATAGSIQQCSARYRPFKNFYVMQFWDRLVSSMNSFSPRRLIIVFHEMTLKKTN